MLPQNKIHKKNLISFFCRIVIKMGHSQSKYHSVPVSETQLPDLSTYTCQELETMQISIKEMQEIISKLFSKKKLNLKLFSDTELKTWLYCNEKILEKYPNKLNALLNLFIYYIFMHENDLVEKQADKILQCPCIKDYFLNISLFYLGKERNVSVSYCSYVLFKLGEYYTDNNNTKALHYYERLLKEEMPNSNTLKNLTMNKIFHIHSSEIKKLNSEIQKLNLNSKSTQE